MVGVILEPGTVWVPTAHDRPCFAARRDPRRVAIEGKADVARTPHFGSD